LCTAEEVEVVESKIVLNVRNVDLNDDKTLATLAEHLDDLGWESMEGQVTATLYTDSADLVGVAIDAARTIETHLPNATVIRVDEQLVAVSDIADRVGMSSEGVRLWTAGKRRNRGAPFPAPRGQVSQGRTLMKVWAWADVLCWLRAQYQLDPEPGVRYPSDREIANLNAGLCGRAGEQDQSPSSGRSAHTRIFDLTRPSRESQEANFGGPLPKNGSRTSPDEDVAADGS
jgi:hypothetical protein